MLSTLFSAAAAFCAPLRPLGAANVARPAFELAARPTMAAAWPTPLHAASRERASAIAMKIFQPDDPCNGYAVLGLKPGASQSDVKAAYRSLAKKLHPDVNPTDKAQQEFQQLAEVCTYAGARAHERTTPHSIAPPGR